MRPGILDGKKILIGPSTFSQLDLAPLERLKGEGAQVIDNPYKRKYKKEELLDLLAKDVEGLIAGLEPLDAEVMETSQLKVISRCGSGMSNVDLDAAKKLNIEVRSTPQGPTIAVAELTLGALLSLLRMIPQLSGDLHAKKWNKQIGVQLDGKTVAVIGFGRIGQKVAALLRGFNVRILAVDPYAEPRSGVESVTLKDALPQADIVTIHCSGEEEILGEKEFASAKEGIFVLNASRGVAVKEAALIQALDSGKVRGAWIDTFMREPYDGPLTDYPQVILTPHIGSYTFEGRRNMEMECVNNLISAFESLQK